MSTATAAFPADDLVALLEESRRNNHAAGLTGMLLYADGHFIQTLEGPPEAVDTTYRRISLDPRHRDVIVALRDDVTERMFGEWSMGFDELEARELTDLPGYDDFLAARSELQRSAAHLGRAGIFHRIFRDRMRTGI
jgi:hypothetical protein